MPDVDVIIVNHGTADLAFAAAESVRARQHPGCRVRIHLVDNASPADDRTRLARLVASALTGSDVHLHLLDRNAGFGAGNNAVLTMLAAGERPPGYVFLLNPDTTLASEAIAILARFLEDHKDAAFAGPQIRLPECRTLRPSAHRFPTLISTFTLAADVPVLYRLFRRWTDPYPRASRPAQVDWVSGAAVMARFAPFRDLGFFDEEYFLYFEEVDLMRRGARAGRTCWHVPGAEVHHAEGGSTGFARLTGDRQRWPAHWYASWARYMRRSHGRLQALAAVGVWLFGDLVNRLAAPLTGRTRTAPLRFHRDLWRYGLRPLLGNGDPAAADQTARSR